MFKFLWNAYDYIHATQVSVNKIVSYASLQSSRCNCNNYGTTVITVIFILHIFDHLPQCCSQKCFVDFSKTSIHSMTLTQALSNCLWYVCIHVCVCVCVWLFFSIFSQLQTIPDLTKGLVCPDFSFGSIASLTVLNIKLIQHGSAIHELP